MRRSNRTFHLAYLSVIGALLMVIAYLVATGGQGSGSSGGGLAGLSVSPRAEVKPSGAAERTQTQPARARFFGRASAPAPVSEVDVEGALQEAALAFERTETELQAFLREEMKHLGKSPSSRAGPELKAPPPEPLGSYPDPAMERELQRVQEEQFRAEIELQRMLEQELRLVR